MPLKLGLIGASLDHSYSKKYFDQKFRNSKDSYTLIPLEEDQLADFLNSTDLDGFNVTIPYKESILRYPCVPSPAVKQIGACNCMLKKNQIWLAYNTDVIGIADTLANFDLQDKKALILGTGGSSRALAYQLSEMNIPYQKVSRRSAPGILSYEELQPKMVKQHQLIVNTTPLGMYPDINACPDIPYTAIGPDHICIDFIYNPEKTLFLAQAEEKRAQTQNGMQMLLSQAEASYEIWANTDPSRA